MAAFVVAALVAVAVPGPTVLLALSNGARHGLRGAGPGIAGALLSDVVLIAAVACGLGAILSTSAIAFEILRWAGVMYLCYLSIRLLAGALRNHANTDRALPEGSERGVRGRFAASLLVALTNPKAYLFFAALLPQFISTASPALPQYALLGAVFLAIDAVIMFTYAAVGAFTGARLGRRGRQTLQGASGAALLAVAIGLAFHRSPAVAGS